jgi:hypothetical protein
MGERLAAALRGIGPAALVAVAAAFVGAAAACDFGAQTPPSDQQAQAPAAPAQPVAPESAPPGSLPPPHAVAPPSADELQRKRAEWQEQQRMAEQAQSELQSWQRSRRPADSGPAVRVGDAARTGESESARVARAMRAWYGRYSARSAAVSLALSQLGMASNSSTTDQRRRLAACRDLQSASQAMLADPQLLEAPIDTVSASLATAYTELKATADSCLAYREEDQSAHLAAARGAMAQAGAALRPYQMVP